MKKKKLWEGKWVKIKEDKLNEGCKKMGKKRRIGKCWEGCDKCDKKR